MVPLMHLLQMRGIDYNFIFMAQHRETIYEILGDFEIKAPDYVLCDTGGDIVNSKQMIIWSIHVLIKGLTNKSKIFMGDKKGIVLIHGDAPPLLLGAILAKSQGLSVGSVEAGLRSHNIWKPFPEELTRVLTGKLGLIDLFFCQDESAINNVSKYRGRSINTFGNTIIDSILLSKDINIRNHNSSKNMNDQFEEYAVVTLHRFETISSKERFSKVIELVIDISSTIPVIFILHPPTRESLIKFNLYNKLNESNRIKLLPRMSFIDFNNFINNSEFIVTDGGSNQEECAHLGIPCLLFRTETERNEGLGKNVVLSKLDPSIIENFLKNYKQLKFKAASTPISPSNIILNNIINYI